MKSKEAAIATFVLSIMGVSAPEILPPSVAFAADQAQTIGQPAVARQIGTVKAMRGNTITLAPDSGPEMEVTILPTARILKIAVGEKNLKNATPIQLQELQSGDRIRVRGQASEDAKSIAALEIIVIARSDLEARHAQERQDWQKRGLGGLVSGVDSGTGTVTISVTGLGGKKNIAVHISKDTVIRRYAPDSVKFDDAKPSTLKEVQPGDQLRARGNRSADGSELMAEEIVTGRFRNVAGTVNSVNASAGTISVQDLLSKKAVQVKITAESQLRKLPPEIAQRIAARFKNGMSPAPSNTAGSTRPEGATAGASQSGTPTVDMKPGSGAVGGAMRPGGGGADMQQMLSRAPAVRLEDLKKGDAVLIVTTQGSDTGGGTAITLLSGVEPILQAAPSGNQATMLTPWSLGGALGGDASQE